MLDPHPIVILPKGGGTFEGNEIFENQEMGFVAGEDAEITVTGGVIRANGHVGIHVEPHGKGTFEGIDISANGKSNPGILVGARAHPVLRRNRIHHHQTSAGPRGRCRCFRGGRCRCRSPVPANT